MAITTGKSKLFKIYYLSEKAITLEFGTAISEETARLVQSFDHLLQKFPFPGLKAVVPAYTTLSIFFEPLEVIASTLLKGIDSFERVADYLVNLESRLQLLAEPATDPIIIPVYYGGEHGKDLQTVAAHTGISPEEIVHLHSSASYRVFMIGFTPGFAYLGGMPEKLATPRKASPEKRVAAGSVGVAGFQTGIYPIASPGGWQIIGQTPLKLFDTNRLQPSLLKAGDRVQFKPVTIEEFQQLKTV